MKERITKLVGTADAKNVWMGTFHSIFARILRVKATGWVIRAISLFMIQMILKA